MPAASSCEEAGWRLDRCASVCNKGEHVEFPGALIVSTLVGPCPTTIHPAPRRSFADPVARAFGTEVRRRREERGETLEQVARRIERMDAKYLGELERGWHAATIPTAKRVADALETPLADLLREI